VARQLGAPLPEGAEAAARALDRQHARGEPRDKWPAKRRI
jgi:hypothetical protein